MYGAARPTSRLKRRVPPGSGASRSHAVLMRLPRAVERSKRESEKGDAEATLARSTKGETPLEAAQATRRSAHTEARPMIVCCGLTPIRGRDRRGVDDVERVDAVDLAVAVDDALPPDPRHRAPPKRCERIAMYARGSSGPSSILATSSGPSW